MPKIQKSSKSKKDRDIEIYQNDRTTSPDPRMFEQPESEQILIYDEPVEPTDPEKMSTGGEMVRGMGKAVKGFKKVIIR